MVLPSRRFKNNITTDAKDHGVIEKGEMGQILTPLSRKERAWLLANLDDLGAARNCGCSVFFLLSFGWFYGPEHLHFIASKCKKL